MGGFTSRIARGLVSLMEARDADGYVFRTDLRLRPDPAVTPPAVALPAAITYYESMGQNWERAAMIKARPVAGDLALGAAFLEAIRPFVWRRGLDFAAVADIHAMKRRIDQHKGGALADGARPVGAHRRPQREAGRRRHPRDRVPGADPAAGLGRPRSGAARPDHAGRAARCWRAPATCRAMPRANWRAAYRFLRRVEHRLQMIADRQVHELPQRPAELARFATFMGYADAAAFAAELLRHLRQVRARYAEVFELVPELLAPGRARRWSWISAASTPRPKPPSAALRSAWASPTPSASSRRCAAGRRGTCGRCARRARANCWRSCCRACWPRSPASRSPTRCSTGSTRSWRASRPACSCCRCSSAIPGLLDRIAAVLGAAPSLANHLASHPAALDGLLSPEENPDPARLLRGRLRDARLLEDVIEITRRTVREEDFSISVATMEGRIDADEAGLRRTAIADAALGALLPPVLADFAARFGRVRGGSMAVVAMGKAGGREMMAGSDLDLMLIYDHPAEVSESRGARRMPVSQWFVRAAHAYVAAVTAPGVDGPLYEVDMRLRPSGNKGPVAVSLGSFRRYHAEAAWTWERMALTRARVVAGPPALRARIEAAIAEALAHAGDAGPHPRRCRVDARAHAARPAAGRPVGREAARRRPDRGGVRRPGAATDPRARGAGTVLADHARRAGAACRGGLAAGGRCGAADPRRPRVADGAGHAAHHRRPRRARGTAGCLRAGAAARRRPDGG